MERSGAAGNFAVRAKLLKTMVGAWGFEPQPPTVSIYPRGLRTARLVITDKYSAAKAKMLPSVNHYQNKYQKERGKTPPPEKETALKSCSAGLEDHAEANLNYAVG